MTAYCAFNSPLLNTNGYTYVGDSSSNLPPNAVPITAIEGLEIVPAANGDVLQWKGNAMQPVVVSGATGTLSLNRQHIINTDPPFADPVVTMPALNRAAVGDLVQIIVLSSGGDPNDTWTVQFNVGQTVAVGSVVSTSGGSVAGLGGNHNVITFMCVSQSPEFWVSFNLTGNVVVT